MTGTETGGRRHSAAGLIAFAIAAISGVLLLGLDLLAWSLEDWNPPGDEVAFGFGLLVVTSLLGLAEILALILGVAGTFQRRRKRVFAVLGVVCSVLVLGVFAAHVDVLALVASFAEPQPTVRTVSP